MDASGLRDHARRSQARAEYLSENARRLRADAEEIRRGLREIWEPALAALPPSQRSAFQVAFQPGRDRLLQHAAWLERHADTLETVAQTYVAWAAWARQFAAEEGGLAE
jgi:hypothetical protein